MLKESACRILLNFGNLCRIIFPKIIDMVVSINNSTYLLLLGELNVNYKGWLTDFGKSDRLVSCISIFASQSSLSRCLTFPLYPCMRFYNSNVYDLDLGVLIMLVFVFLWLFIYWEFLIRFLNHFLLNFSRLKLRSSFSLHIF